MQCKTRFLKIFILVIVATTLLSAIVMALWNWLLPPLLPGVHQLGYLQALGLFVLCRILFGGIRGGGWRRHQGRLESMSEEDRRKFKEGMRAFRGGWRGCGKTDATKQNSDGQA